MVLCFVSPCSLKSRWILVHRFSLGPVSCTLAFIRNVTGNDQGKRFEKGHKHGSQASQACIELYLVVHSLDFSNLVILVRSVGGTGAVRDLFDIYTSFILRNFSACATNWGSMGSSCYLFGNKGIQEKEGA